MTNNVYWLLELTIKEGELSNLKGLMEEMITATQNDEPGALAYEWWITDDQKACHIYERYTDSDAVMTHLGNFGSKFAERFMGSVEPTRFMVYGKASDQVKEALAAFGAVYMESFGGFVR